MTMNLVAYNNRTVLETRNPKARCWKGCAQSENSKGESFLFSFDFWWLWASLGLRLHHSNLCLHLPQTNPLWASSPLPSIVIRTHWI